MKVDLRRVSGGIIAALLSAVIAAGAVAPVATAVEPREPQTNTLGSYSCTNSFSLKMVSVAAGGSSYDSVQHGFNKTGTGWVYTYWHSTVKATRASYPRSRAVKYTRVRAHTVWDHYRTCVK